MTTIKMTKTQRLLASKIVRLTYMKSTRDLEAKIFEYIKRPQKTSSWWKMLPDGIQKHWNKLSIEGKLVAYYCANTIYREN